MDFGNYGGGVCEAAASDPSSATVANLLSSSGGASNGVGLGVPAFTKTTVSRSAVPEPDFGKPRTQDDRSADGSVLKIPFELRQQQQNHHSGGSGNSSSDGSAQQLQLLGRAHNSGGAAGIVGDVASPWAVHAHLQHQSYSPFRASAGMPRLPMAMPLSVTGMNGGGTAGAALNVQRGGGSYCFTPMQWQELEHQALIYKYILAEEPVPQELLIPIKRSLAGAADFLHHQPNLGGWNSFQMRFANVKADAEPGRCRRTDGKKWRCSRDAAPDQKYCERHMHRGRPRSRKPVEGGHTAAINGGGGSSSSNTNNNNSNSTSVSTSAATSSSASATAAAQSLNNNNSIIGGNPASSCNGSSSPSSFGSLASVSRSSVSSSVRPAATTDSSRAAAADQFLNLKSLTTAAASTASINGGQSHFKSPLNMVKDYRYMNWMKGDNGNVSSSSEDHQLLLSDTHGSSKRHHQHHHHHYHLSNNSNSCTTTDAQTHHQNQNQHIVAAAAASNLNPAAANNWRSCWGPPSTKLNMSSTAAQQAMLQRYSLSLMGSGGGSNNSSSHSHNTHHHSCNLSDFSVLQEQQNLSHHSNNNNTHSLFLTDTQQPLRHFIDDWGAAAAAAAAAAEEHSRSTATQLSMSSMAASTDLGLGLMNNNSTTTNTNTSDRHSHHSTNNNNNNRSSSSNSYVPVALGGPLAEVLQHNSAAPVNPAAAAAAGLCRSGTTAVKASAGALNLLSNEVWELSSTSPQESPRMASSPTGVLQKTLASLSDSSSGSTAAAAVKHDTLHNLASV